MDQDGNYFIGDKIIDTKTGNETNLNSGESDSKVFKRLTVTERLLLYPNSTLDLRSAQLNFDIRSRFLAPIPTDSGVYATTESPGFVELTTNQETIDGLDDKRAVTPASLAAALAGILASIDEISVTPNYSDILDAVTPVGTIRSVIRTTLPSSRWEFARGQEVNRSTISATLVSELVALGAPYNGNGTTTVQLPDGRDRTLVGAGGDYGLGSTGGVKEVSLTAAQNGQHAHGISDPGHAHGIYDPGHSHQLFVNRNDGSGENIADSNGGNEFLPINWPNSTSGIRPNGTNIGIYPAGTGIGINTSGEGQAHNNMQPYLAVNFIIKVR
jgi:microcystin-dependent protein